MIKIYKLNMPTPLEQIKEILPKEKEIGEMISLIENPMGGMEQMVNFGRNQYRTEFLTLLPQIDQIYKEWFKGEVKKKITEWRPWFFNEISDEDKKNLIILLLDLTKNQK